MRAGLAECSCVPGTHPPSRRCAGSLTIHFVYLTATHFPNITEIPLSNSRISPVCWARFVDRWQHIGTGELRRLWRATVDVRDVMSSLSGSHVAMKGPRDEAVGTGNEAVVAVACRRGTAAR